MTKRKRRAQTIAAVAIVTGILFGAGMLAMADEPMTAAQYAADPAAMIEAYRHVESGSVSDAIEQTLHRKSYMSHRMQAIRQFGGI